MLSNKTILNFQKRKEICDFISENPGLHLREISRKMNIPLSTLNFHIRYLVKQGLIEARFMSKFKRYWVSNKIGAKEKELLGLLRNEITCNILIVFSWNNFRSQIELSKELEMKPSAVNYHLKKLVKFGIIEEAPYKNGLIERHVKGYYIKRNRAGNETIYRLKNGVLTRIFNIITAYYKSLPSDYVIETMDEYIKKPYEIKPFLKYKIFDYKKHDPINMAIDALLQLFPVPFCA